MAAVDHGRYIVHPGLDCSNNEELSHTGEGAGARVHASETFRRSEVWDLDDAAVRVDEHVVTLDVSVYYLVVMLQQYRIHDIATRALCTCFHSQFYRTKSDYTVTPNPLQTSLPAPMYIYAHCLFRMLFLSIIQLHIICYPALGPQGCY